MFKNCKRYDLLNVFYQSTGQWGKALETAEMYDRVHLRTTYYNYAKHLEAKGDIHGAIPKYARLSMYMYRALSLVTYMCSTKLIGARCLAATRSRTRTASRCRECCSTSRQR